MKALLKYEKSGLSHEEFHDILVEETCWPFSYDEPFPTQLKEALARYMNKDKV